MRQEQTEYSTRKVDKDKQNTAKKTVIKQHKKETLITCFLSGKTCLHTGQ